MTNDALARLHAAAMTLPRPWAAHEIGVLRLMPGAIECTRAEGFALGRIAADEAELLTIAVLPDARRNGIGRALLAAYHEAAARLGAVTSYLEVAETNEAARALYALDGYAEVGRRAGYYTEVTPHVAAIVMSRSL
ncbi:ribosomal-protein-alanine N-acetyltransferase [Palleronia marisminoris]|uniref:Ribosomal-protein-alanine N-acetyltransferase n=1 Tax=Palleronia marisminoris TaxID=315423 RepID=A0A1Y5RUP9_9RHOB|nr:GNAT family N-acetyltransferase [Palleronia marisminoris]SFG47008.1 ribosomal-protein-alanine N-acetyltransferase [Palleronia marisminoris]SLN25564.1 ribosomal-protein-alanine N-acetyltransferase [Palleronia marisminoris]